MKGIDSTEFQQETRPEMRPAVEDISFDPPLDELKVDERVEDGRTVETVFRGTFQVEYNSSDVEREVEELLSAPENDIFIDNLGPNDTGWCSVSWKAKKTVDDIARPRFEARSSYESRGLASNDLVVNNKPVLREGIVLTIETGFDKEDEYSDSPESDEDYHEVTTSMEEDMDSDEFKQGVVRARQMAEELAEKVRKHGISCEIQNLES